MGPLKDLKSVTQQPCTALQTYPLSSDGPPQNSKTCHAAALYSIADTSAGTVTGGCPCYHTLGAEPRTFHLVEHEWEQGPDDAFYGMSRGSEDTASSGIAAASHHSVSKERLLQAHSSKCQEYRTADRLTRIMPMPTGTQRTVEMRAILAVCHSWSCVDRCEGGALLAKLLPKKTASAQTMHAELLQLQRVRLRVHLVKNSPQCTNMLMHQSQCFASLVKCTGK